MKLVVAIIRPDRLNNVLEELFRARIAGVTISRVQGHGGETERVETYRGMTVKMELSEKVRGGMRSEAQALPKHHQDAEEG